jgi:DNA-binding LacI/PurR family transcriptional regulator
MSMALPDLSVEGGEAARPKYERLKAHLLTEMREGRLQPGVALPSEKRLAESLNVARSTVRQAMAALEQDGVVSRIHGKGTFVHDQAWQRLKSGTGLYALVVPETQFGFYPALLKSFGGSAEAAHHQVVVCNTDNDIDKQGNAILQLIDHEVDGVAIVPTTVPTTPAFQIRQLQKHGIPVVFCSRRVDGIRAPLLAIPFEQVGRLAGEAARAAGHRRAAFFGTHRARSTVAYEAGFRQALAADNPGTRLESFCGEGSSPAVADHEEEFAAGLKRLIIDRDDPPTVIFAGFDSLAELLYLQLTQAGYRVPEDISIISFGGTQRAHAVARRLTAVTVDEVGMGRMAVDYLDRMRRGTLAVESEETVDLPLSLHAGATLGPPRGG